MDFGLKVKFDANEEGGALELSVVVNGPLEQVACFRLPSVSVSEPSSLADALVSCPIDSRRMMDRGVTDCVVRCWQ